MVYRELLQCAGTIASTVLQQVLSVVTPQVHASLRNLSQFYQYALCYEGSCQLPNLRSLTGAVMTVDNPTLASNWKHFAAKVIPP